MTGPQDDLNEDQHLAQHHFLAQMLGGSPQDGLNIAGVHHVRFLLVASLHIFRIFTMSWDWEYNYHGKSQCNNIRLLPLPTQQIVVQKKIEGVNRIRNE
jgi:hypothetical protein